MNNQPYYILPEGAQRTYGRNAQRLNIHAAKLVAEAVRTTLGPKGMDKMIVDNLGDVIITNDGVTILEEMQIEHPSAKMIVEIAKTQENEVGDGTTTAVILAGELLSNAEKLLDQNVHPTVIAKGYRLAANKSYEILNKLAVDISNEDDEILKKISLTAMTGKGAEASKEKLAEITTKAIKQIIDKQDSKIIIDLDNIKIEKKVGGSVDNTELIEGIVLDKGKVHSSMPLQVKDAKIALINSPIEIKETETDAKIQITDPNQLNAFIEQEERMLKQMVEKIVNSGANVLFCQKGIDDFAQHYLAKNNIFAVRRVKKSDMEKLSKATGAKIITNLDDLREQDLGYAGLIEEQKVNDDEMTFVKLCKNPKAVTILVRGGTEHVIDEVKRALEDALGDLSSALKDNKVLAGAGSVEIELSKALKDYSSSLSGREQLAVLSFAESLEVIPKTLAENGGLDPIDVLTELKAKHDENNKWFGIDVFDGKVKDAWQMGVIEPLKVKTQAISSASEVAIMILRIDDVIAGSKTEKSEPNMDMS